MLEVFQEVIKLLETGRKGAVATIISTTGSTPGKNGARMLVREDGSTVHLFGYGGAVKGGADFHITKNFALFLGAKVGVIYSKDIQAPDALQLEEEYAWRPLGIVANGRGGVVLVF